MKTQLSVSLVLVRMMLCAVLQVPLFLPAAASGADLPEGFTGFVSADFQQTRNVKALDRPLLSSGSIEITASGFIWTQLQPFENILTFDGETITETTRVGEQEISRALADPITTSITRTLYGMMTGTWQDIQGFFEIIEGEAESSPIEKNAWARDLIPRDPELQDLIPGISLSGGRFLERIEVQQKEGASTVIELSEHQIVK